MTMMPILDEYADDVERIRDELLRRLPNPVAMATAFARVYVQYHQFEMETRRHLSQCHEQIQRYHREREYNMAAIWERVLDPETERLLDAFERQRTAVGNRSQALASLTTAIHPNVVRVETARGAGP